MPVNESSLISAEKCIHESVMRPSASFVCGDIRGQHQPSLSSLELSSMLATWVDSKKCKEYEHELLYSSGLDFQAAALKRRLSDDGQQSCERERPNFSASKGLDWRCHASVSSEHVEDFLEPASHNIKASKRGLADADPFDTCCKLPRYIFERSILRCEPNGIF